MYVDSEAGDDEADSDNSNTQSAKASSILDDFQTKQLITRDGLYERIYDSIRDGTSGKKDFVALVQASQRLTMKESAANFHT